MGKLLGFLAFVIFVIAIVLMALYQDPILPGILLILGWVIFAIGCFIDRTKP